MNHVSLFGPSLEMNTGEKGADEEKILAVVAEIP